MQILTIDIGTGTQDVFLFRSGLSLENGLRLVMPSPTMIVRRKIRQATEAGAPLLLTGVTMGGGPSQWAVEAHRRAGLQVYATPAAARSFNDDLDWVRRALGVRIIGDDEARRLTGVVRIELGDFDYPRIVSAFESFGLALAPRAVAVAVFDHGAAPPDVSDRKFRFEYLEARVRSGGGLTAFAHRAESIPPALTRMRAVADSAGALDAPLVMMDTAPAAVLGASLDPRVAARTPRLSVNVGNFHTLAMRIGAEGIEGVFEHHTGMLSRTKLDDFLERFAAGRLTNEEVFADQGHGALTLTTDALDLASGPYGVAVTGPRRELMFGSRLRPYFAVPAGDMMSAGCFGLLLATAELVPETADAVHAAVSGDRLSAAPWDVD